MTTDASENTTHKGQPYRAFRIAHQGKQGSFIGRYTTAVEAAVAVARDVRERGLDRRTLMAALDKGLKGEALLNALDGGASAVGFQGVRGAPASTRSASSALVARRGERGEKSSAVSAACPAGLGAPLGEVQSAVSSTRGAARIGVS